jgi:hypothetical protein
MFKKYWIMCPQCAPSANTQYFLNFPKKVTGKCRLGLSLNLPDEIIDHVGQLLDLDVLTVNTTIQLIHYLPYSVGGIPNEVNTFVQTIDSSDLVVQHVDLGQKLSPYGGGILGLVLTPFLALLWFRLEQPTFQQAIQ